MARRIESFQGLCSLLEAAVSEDACPIEGYLEEIWVAIFPQVCDEIDYSSPTGAKNQNEVLRCFHVTCMRPRYTTDPPTI